MNHPSLSPIGRFGIVLLIVGFFAMIIGGSLGAPFTASALAGAAFGTAGQLLAQLRQMEEEFEKRGPGAMPIVMFLFLTNCGLSMAGVGIGYGLRVLVSKIHF